MIPESVRWCAGYFVTRIFHPNIAKNGEICVNTLKKDWKPTLGLRHVLLVSPFWIPIISYVENLVPILRTLSLYGGFLVEMKYHVMDCSFSRRLCWRPIYIWLHTSLTFQHDVQVVRCLLIEPFPESALNEEAGKMLMEDYEGYAKHARSFCWTYQHEGHDLVFKLFRTQ